MKWKAIMRENLITAYLDFINNYWTVDKWASDNELSLEEANNFLRVANRVFYAAHPES